MSTEFRPLSTRALHALELHDLNLVDTSWSAFNYYLETVLDCVYYTYLAAYSVCTVYCTHKQWYHVEQGYML